MATCRRSPRRSLQKADFAVGLKTTAHGNRGWRLRLPHPAEQRVGPSMTSVSHATQPRVPNPSPGAPRPDRACSCHHRAGTRETAWRGFRHDGHTPEDRGEASQPMDGFRHVLLNGITQRCTSNRSRVCSRKPPPGITGRPEGLWITSTSPSS